MAEIAIAIGLMFAGYAINKILDQYLRVPLILKTRYLKHKGMAYNYTGKQATSNYWKDLLGPDFGLESGAEKILREYYQVTFEDVVLTDFVPRAPGYYYSKELWEDPKKALFSLGVVRLIPNENTGPKRLLAINRPSEFEAHGEIEKGIPIVVSEDVYRGLIRDLEKFGSVHIDKIIATMSSVGTYSKYLLAKGIPSLFPVVKSMKYVRKGGDPIPTMGNAWLIYRTQSEAEFLNFRFWTGVEYYQSNLKEAKETIEKFIPKGGLPVTDFDEKIPYFMNAILQPNDVWKYLAKMEL